MPKAKPGSVSSTEEKRLGNCKGNEIFQLLYLVFNTAPIVAISLLRCCLLPLLMFFSFDVFLEYSD